MFNLKVIKKSDKTTIEEEVDNIFHIITSIYYGKKFEKEDYDTIREKFDKILELTGAYDGQ